MRKVDVLFFCIFCALVASFCCLPLSSASSLPLPSCPLHSAEREKSENQMKNVSTAAAALCALPLLTP